MRTFSPIKKTVYYLWIGSIVFFAYLYLFQNHYFDAEFLSNWIRRYENQVWGIYILMSFIRGFFLLPSTPFVFLGIVLFPQYPLLVLITSMSGVVFSATILYYFSDSIGFSQYFERKYPKQSRWMRNRLGAKYRLLFIFSWAIFPPAPTDLICYLSGILKIRYEIMITGIFFGELTLTSIYIILGPDVVDYFNRFL